MVHFSSSFQQIWDGGDRFGNLEICWKTNGNNGATTITTVANDGATINGPLCFSHEFFQIKMYFNIKNLIHLFFTAKLNHFSMACHSSVNITLEEDSTQVSVEQF